MKRLLSLCLLLCAMFSAQLAAQQYKTTKLLTDGGLTYIVDVDINIPNSTPRLDSIVHRAMFGDDKTFEESFTQYFSKFKAGSKDTKQKVTLNLFAHSGYSVPETGLLSVQYSVLDESLSACRKIKYILYDLKNQKVVKFNDLIIPALQSHIKSQGIETDDVDNIKPSYMIYVVNTSSNDITMHMGKLYKYMTDYSFELMGMNRQEFIAEMEDTTAQGTKVYDVVERNAEFPGGNEACFSFLQKHIRYPRKAQENNIQGRVFVSFTIDKDGSITHVQVLDSPDESLSEEAIRVIKSMPNWIPARQGNRVVRSRFNMPIMFRL